MFMTQFIVLFRKARYALHDKLLYNLRCLSTIVVSLRAKSSNKSIRACIQKNHANIKFRIYKKKHEISYRKTKQ